QVGGLELALQVIGLVAHHEVFAPGNAELDVNDRRDGAVAVIGALIHVHPAGYQALVHLLELGDAAADFIFRPIRTLDVVETDLEGNLKGHRKPRYVFERKRPSWRIVSTRGVPVIRSRGHMWRGSWASGGRLCSGRS